MRHKFESICPYFAMFPASFAEYWIKKCTKPGQLVADPFSGRGTAPLQSLLMGRHTVAGDVNPVAFVLTGAKVDSPARASILRRLNALDVQFDEDRFSTRQQHYRNSSVVHFTIQLCGRYFTCGPHWTGANLAWTALFRRWRWDHCTARQVRISATACRARLARSRCTHLSSGMSVNCGHERETCFLSCVSGRATDSSHHLRN